jgi:hypothetical protein
VKRFGCLFGEVCSFPALCLAARQAARGKKGSPRVADFLRDLEPEVIALESELATKTYRPRPYRTFMVFDPKERMICAADFRDRVVHHAVCRVLEPIFERGLIHDTYACRRGKGTLRAIQRARAFAQRFEFFLKLDVHKFFDSVDHAVLKELLRRKIKDRDLLWLLDVFIDHPVPWTPPGVGIPIGNLTSQHFASFYLSGVDHLVKEALRIGGYVRYMDDLVLFADEKDTLWDAAARVRDYLESRLRLRVKEGSTLLAPTRQGLPFLGLRLFPGVVRLSRPSWRRFRDQMIANAESATTGALSEEEWTRSTLSLVGGAQRANTCNLRRRFFAASSEAVHDEGGSFVIRHS